MKSMRHVFLYVLTAMAGVLAGWYFQPHHGDHPVVQLHPSLVHPRRILYWYDPMLPQQHFDHPGKSPTMNMDMVPKYADEVAASVPAVSIAPLQSQELGMRQVSVQKGTLIQHLHVSAVVRFDDRQVSVLQARADGYLEQVVAHTTGDSVHQGEVLAKLRVPAWAAAEAEYLTLLQSGAVDLAQSARQRLVQLGMTDTDIRTIAQGGKVQDVLAIRAPRTGVLLDQDLRPGMIVSKGQTLVRVNALDQVWIEAEIPQEEIAIVHMGQLAQIRFTGNQRVVMQDQDALWGRVRDILPAMNADSRTLVARIALPNRDHHLRPGMFADVDIQQSLSPHLFVPSEAVVRDGQRSLVFRVQGTGHYVPVEVRTGVESAGRTEILAGLNLGDSIVVSGQFLLDSEANINNLAIQPLPHQRESTASDQARHPPATVPGASTMEGM